jgi:hypothetical protein
MRQCSVDAIRQRRQVRWRHRSGAHLQTAGHTLRDCAIARLRDGQLRDA